MRNLLLSLSLILVGFTTAASADTFNFSGVTASNSIGTGTIITDASGVAIKGQISFTGGKTQGTYYFDSASTLGSTPQLNLSSNEDYSFYLLLQTSLAGVSTDNICRDDMRCAAPQNYYSVVRSSSTEEGFASGTLTLQTAPPPVVAAPTPEPSSLILLGTGILGAAGAARRKFLHRA